MNKELYLVLGIIGTFKEWKKYFMCEYDMDKFKRKLKYSNKVYVIQDSRELYYPDYNLYNVSLITSIQ